MSYVDTMKAALREYFGAKKQSEAGIASIAEEYGNEAAAKERSRHEEILAGIRTEAEQKIAAAAAEGMCEVDRWARLNGSDVTDDTKLLEAGILDPQTFAKLVDKYQWNRTMLEILRQYGTEKNAKSAVDHLGIEYDLTQIPTPESKKAAWQALREGALNILDMIDGKGPYTGPYMKAFVHSFDDKIIEQLGQGVKV